MARRTPFRFLAIAFVTAIACCWFAIGHPPLGEIGTSKYWIDVNTGDTKIEHYLGTRKVSSNVVQTEFSERVRRYGLELHPPVWQQWAQRNYISSLHINFVFGGAKSVCSHVGRMIEVFEVNDERAKPLVGKYLQLLRQGRIRDMECELNADLQTLQKLQR